VIRGSTLEEIPGLTSGQPSSEGKRVSEERSHTMTGEKRILLLISLAVGLVVSPAFSQTQKTSSATAKPIVIGGSLSLTGVFSETAKWVKEGYNFWAEDINKRGGLLGRPVKLVLYDDEGSAEKAVTYYERAITVDKVDLVFGGYPATSNVALMPHIEKYGKVFIGMGGQRESFEQGYTYSFGSPALISDHMYIPLEGVFDELIAKADYPKSAAVLAMNNVIGLSGRGNIVKSLEAHGIKVVVNETYNLPLTDSTPLLAKARERQAELLCCLSFFDDGVMLTRSAKAMNYNPKLLFQLFAPTIPAWMKELGQDGNNVVSTIYWSPRLPFPDNDKIVEAVKARYKLPAPPQYFGYAYCWMKTLELAVHGANTLNDRAIRDYLRSHKFDLPYGLGVTFDEKGLPPQRSTAYAVQSTNGIPEIIWPKKVATTNLVYPRPNWGK
jgi:branched-chain amino acid transport system substrate-binding protein